MREGLSLQCERGQESSDDREMDDDKIQTHVKEVGLLG